MSFGVILPVDRFSMGNIALNIKSKIKTPGVLRSVVFRARRLLGHSVYPRYYLESGSIFIHIPKAAGKSVSTALYNDDKPGHYYASDYFNENSNAFNTSFKFAFVRDPVERLKSAYYFLIGGGGNSEDKRFGELLSAQTNCFDDFVLNWLDNETLYSWIHFVPQSDFLCIDDKLAVDYLGRFENIDNDFIIICEKAGFKAKLEKMNVTKIKKKVIHSELVISRIHKLYKKDYELLG